MSRSPSKCAATLQVLTRVGFGVPRPYQQGPSMSHSPSCSPGQRTMIDTATLQLPC